MKVKRKRKYKGRRVVFLLLCVYVCACKNGFLCFHDDNRRIQDCQLIKATIMFFALFIASHFLYNSIFYIYIGMIDDEILNFKKKYLIVDIDTNTTFFSSSYSLLYYKVS